MLTADQRTSLEANLDSLDDHLDKAILDTLANRPTDLSVLHDAQDDLQRARFILTVGEVL